MAILCIRYLGLLVVLFLQPEVLWGQTKIQNTFVSDVDRALTVRNVLVAPVEDNVGGIYSRPIEEHLKDLLVQDEQWTPSDFNDLKKFNLQTLYTTPNEVMRLSQSAQADAILKVRISKGTAGLKARMTLFSGADGLPIVEQNLQASDKFEINAVKSEFTTMLSQLRRRLPYRAEVLSRRGQEITFNAGKRAGITMGSEVSMVQILKLHRHPKLNFIVSTEKEILGKARVFKVDDTLSFAHLLMEREIGVVQPGTKILPDEYVRYAEPYITEDGQVLEDLAERKDKDLAYGEKPDEWLPEKSPQFGKVQTLGGITQYTQSSSFLRNGNIDGTNNLAPTLGVNGEFWINQAWFLGLDLRSSAFTVTNNLPASRPEKINMTLNSYYVHGGYNFLLSPDFFGPKLQLTAGLAKFSSHAEESSPITFTNMDFGGIALGFAGQFPVGEDNKTDLGAKFKYYWRPNLSETKSSGSSGDIRINDFGFFFNHHMKPKFSYIGELKFEYYSAGFSGPGARPEEVTSISHKVTTLLFGVEFLF